uniref:Coiled-coil domain-containing protein 18-like n=1 Tax=Saccoglossus kowalevskii TaxID=10224 RepID=A0ABM0MGL4_SACKO|nr:PREDICTED: coiled-coil domain-containing protein 18-like [Saccoglossus kowalevskii]
MWPYLVEANEELMNRDRELTDLDQALKERQWELKQRAAQVAQLDMTMKEHRSELETKVVKLEEQLSKSQQNLKERSKQKTKELSSKLNDHRKDELEQGQHLRLTREQMQRQHMDLTDTKKQLAKSQREQDRMARELEETIQVCKSKELDCSKLAEELGASRAREAAADSRCIAEIHHLRQQLELDIKQKDIEISSLQESHSTLLAAKNQQETNHRLHSQQLEERNKHITQQLQTTEDKLTSLENELRARKEVVEAANEAIVIKEAEVARLNAKISGYERATFGMRNRESSSSRHNLFSINVWIRTKHATIVTNARPNSANSTTNELLNDFITADELTKSHV